VTRPISSNLPFALVVVEKRVEAIIGHEQIGPAIVIIVSRPHGEILTLSARRFPAFRYVCESAVAVVVVQKCRECLCKRSGATRFAAA